MASRQPLERRREILPPKGDVVLGIDLGTTYTCAALVEAKHASVLASRWGSPTIPSVVAFLADGRTLVGESALRYSSDPRRLIVGSKRIFGRAYHSPIVQEAKDHFSYEIVEGPGGDAAIRVDQRIIDLEDVAAAILREVRESAALQIEGRVNRAVITCPAHFNERQREAVRVAGERAGFHVERVLSEPTAAALHFGLGRGMTKRKVLVYDLGGGTFDVSLLEVDGDVFEVLGTGGDTFLGGIDFDACIADLIVEALLEKEHIDARTDPVAVARVLEYAERAKRDLSDRTATIVQIDHLTVQPHAPRALTVPIKRTRVEELWSPLGARAQQHRGREPPHPRRSARRRRLRSDGGRLLRVQPHRRPRVRRTSLQPARGPAAGQRSRRHPTPRSRLARDRRRRSPEHHPHRLRGPAAAPGRRR
jgi:molecular chaperone DnaK